jgi:nucleotide-binding universal stress UspA family protein
MPEGTSHTGPVVVGIDGSEASMAALDHAVREATWREVELHVLHVLDVTPAVLHLAGEQTIHTRELAESDRDEIWKVAAPIIDSPGVDVVKLNREGDPAEALLEHCTDVGASVLVVGPRGRGRVIDALLGSTAQRVIREATCSVLVVKASRHDANP